MRILVVEDERKAAEYLQKGLSESGYQDQQSAADDFKFSTFEHNQLDCVDSLPLVSLAPSLLSGLTW